MIKLTSILKQITESVVSRKLKTEQTEEPPKRKRGRPSKADVAARRAAETAKKVKKGQSSLSPEIRADIEAARERIKAKDAAAMADARAELDAAMKQDKGVKGKTKSGRSVTMHALPQAEEPTPTGRGKSREGDDNGDDGETYDIDKRKMDEETDEQHARDLERSIRAYERGGDEADKEALEYAKKMQRLHRQKMYLKGQRRRQLRNRKK